VWLWCALFGRESLHSHLKLYTQRCEKAEVTRPKQVTDAPPRYQSRTGMSPGHPHVSFDGTLWAARKKPLQIQLRTIETTLKALRRRVRRAQRRGVQIPTSLSESYWATTGYWRTGCTPSPTPPKPSTMNNRNLTKRLTHHSIIRGHDRSASCTGTFAMYVRVRTHTPACAPRRRAHPSSRHESLITAKHVPSESEASAHPPHARMRPGTAIITNGPVPQACIMLLLSCGGVLTRPGRGGRRVPAR
jgi:hypothetical protein